MRLVRKNAVDWRKHFASINFFGSSSSAQTHGPPFNPMQWVQRERYNKSNLDKKMYSILLVPYYSIINK